MNDADGAPMCLGDLLGAHLAQVATAPEAVSALPEPSGRRAFDKSLVRISEALGEDPSEVLKLFHKDEPLARIFRKIMGVDVPVRPMNDAVETYIISERFRQRGLRGKANYRAVADEINFAHDAAGNRFRTIDAESVRKMAKRGEQQFAAEMAGVVGGLASLFGKP